MSEPDSETISPRRDDPTDWEIHAALTALERAPHTESPWLRGLDEYYWLKLEGNRSGYIYLARVLLRAASTRAVNVEYVARDEANSDLTRLMVPSSQLRLQLAVPTRETPPPSGAVGARRLRAQLQHAAALWGCGLAAFISVMIALFLAAAGLGLLQD